MPPSADGEPVADGQPASAPHPPADGQPPTDGQPPARKSAAGQPPAAQLSTDDQPADDQLRTAAEPPARESAASRRFRKPGAKAQSTDGQPAAAQLAIEPSTASDAPTGGQPATDGERRTAAQPPARKSAARRRFRKPGAGAQPAAEPPAAVERAGGEASREVLGSAAGSGVGAPRHLAAGSRRWRALVGVLVAAGVVGVLGVGAMLVDDAGSEGTGAATGTAEAPSRATTSESVTTTSTTVVVASPEEAFAGAVSRLESAGTFAYQGTVSASDVSAVRPSLWLAVDITVEGEVSLGDGLVHEVAVAENGRATETVVAGVDVFGRSARSRDSLVDQAYEGIPELSLAEPETKGAAGLARWLAGVTEPTAAGVDEQGRRVYRATIPASVLGPTERGRRAVDAEVLLTLDRAGDPVHVDITTVPEGPPLHLALELSELGAPVAIEPPALAEG